MITPLFALDAEDLYDAGQFTDAAALCRKGLEHYPEYASGYAVLYRSLIALEQYDDALNAVSRGLEAMPANRILLRLSTEHEVLMRQFDGDGGEDVEYPALVIDTVETDDAAKLPEDLQVNDGIASLPDATVYNNEAHEDVDTSSDETVSVISQVNTITEATNQNVDLGNLTNVAIVLDSMSIDDSVTEENIPVEFPSTVRTVYPPLRIIDTTDGGDKVMIRASSVGLIPGLHFAPAVLRTVHHKPSDELPDLPPFKKFAPRHYLTKDKKSVKSRTPLEELAARLERARISIVQEENVPSTHTGAEIVSTATDTVAKIYESQGAFSQAIKVYQQLARSKPEFREEYEAKIGALHHKIEEKKLLS